MNKYSTCFLDRMPKHNLTQSLLVLNVVGPYILIVVFYVKIYNCMRNSKAAVCLCFCFLLTKSGDLMSYIKLVKRTFKEQTHWTPLGLETWQQDKSNRSQWTITEAQRGKKRLIQNGQSHHDHCCYTAGIVDTDVSGDSKLTPKPDWCSQGREMSHPALFGALKWTGPGGSTRMAF